MTRLCAKIFLALAIVGGLIFIPALSTGQQTNSTVVVATAQELMNKGECDLALMELQSLQSAAGDPLAIHLFAETYECLGKLELAIEYYGKYLELIGHSDKVINKLSVLRASLILQQQCKPRCRDEKSWCVVSCVTRNSSLNWKKENEELVKCFNNVSGRVGKCRSDKSQPSGRCDRISRELAKRCWDENSAGLSIGHCEESCEKQVERCIFVNC